ncbi:DUF4142 domain-containing protein [Roseomonas sp. BN140053]|uniref:DUF4142 domain-containing protein n=1 Tax=Roseomonas sp. BN140053 TaxID=3391898 RepID=UPI0039EA3724
MLNRRTLAVALAGTALLGRATLAQTNPAAVQQNLQGLSPDALRTLALQGGAFLMQSAQIAVDKPTRAPLKQFAQFEVDEQQGIMRTLQLAGYQVAPPALTPDKTMLLQRLTSATENGFEPLFVEAQMTAHQEAANVYNAMVRSTAAPLPDRVLASLALGRIDEHMKMLAGMLAAR